MSWRKVSQELKELMHLSFDGMALVRMVKGTGLTYN